MRIVASLPPVATGFGGREVKGLTGASTDRQVRAHGQTIVTFKQRKPHEHHETEQHDLPQEERRKICRRVSHQPVLVEMRSGADRRRHNLREDDVVEHIDIEA